MIGLLFAWIGCGGGDGADGRAEQAPPGGASDPHVGHTAPAEPAGADAGRATSDERGDPHAGHGVGAAAGEGTDERVGPRGGPAGPHAGHASEPPADPHAGHGPAGASEGAGEGADEHAGHTSSGGSAPVVEVTPIAREALGIRTTPARSGSVGSAQRFPATVGWDPQAVLRVFALPGGQVRDLRLPRVGERVERGALVARLYAPEIVAACREMLIARDLGEEWAEPARERLRYAGVPRHEVERAWTTGTCPDTYGVYAPAAGTVVERPVVEGSVVPPGGTVAVVAAGEKVVVDVMVPGAPPEVGAEVVLRDPRSGEAWPARVAALLPTGDPSGSAVRLVPQAGEGSPPVGRPLVAEWSTAEIEGVWVPRDALIDTGERQVVFVQVAEGGYAPRAVRVGARAGDQVQILEGVEPGEPVVVSAAFLLDSETQIGAMGHAGHGG